jgi:hypothetical protein
VGWKDAAQSVLRVLLERGAHPDPYLELLRLGAESEHIGAAVTVTLILDGALVTGTVISPTEWEDRFLWQLQEEDNDLRRAVRVALRHLEDAAEKGRRREPDRRHVHLGDVIYRAGRASHILPIWRGPVTAISGWTLGEPDPGGPVQSTALSHIR